MKQTDLRILLRVICPITEKDYVQELTKCFEESRRGEQKKRRSEDWWKQLWNRSYIFINRQKADPNDKDWQMGRNYQLFRYMLACNAYGESIRRSLMVDCLRLILPCGGAGEAAKELSLGRDTYYYAWDSEDQLNYEGWMYSGICAARLGLTQEAYAFMQKKLASAPKRFPAFWGPGFDYTPDHNWCVC